jgi:hypothetical protein
MPPFFQAKNYCGASRMSTDSLRRPHSPMTDRTTGPAAVLSRRDFLRIGLPIGLTLSAGFVPLATTHGAGMDKGAKALAKLKGASLAQKVRLLQEVYEGVAFSDSGIMYSMLRLEADGNRAGEDDAGLGLNA